MALKEKKYPSPALLLRYPNVKLFHVGQIVLLSVDLSRILNFIDKY
jgi:hypothetical protein